MEEINKLTETIIGCAIEVLPCDYSHQFNSRLLRDGIKRFIR